MYKLDEMILGFTPSRTPLFTKPVPKPLRFRCWIPGVDFDGTYIADTASEAADQCRACAQVLLPGLRSYTINVEEDIP